MYLNVIPRIRVKLMTLFLLAVLAMLQVHRVKLKAKCDLLQADKEKQIRSLLLLSVHCLAAGLSVAISVTCGLRILLYNRSKDCPIQCRKVSWMIVCFAVHVPRMPSR